VTTLADATVVNTDGVSVTLERHGRLMTVAASNDVVLRMDGHQYDTGQGPCLAAKADNQRYYVESLDDEARWPAFVPLALEQGIRSILSSPLKTADRPLGALNIYSNTQRAFGDDQQKLAALFAMQASEILSSARADLTDEQLDKRFADAQATRQTIARAEGVLMQRHDVGPTSAVMMLHTAARNTGLTVLEYATQVLASYTSDDGGSVVPGS